MNTLEIRIRKYWDLKKYKHKLVELENDKPEPLAGEYDPGDDNKLNRALQSDLFWCLCKMISEVGFLAERISRWCGGCPCHGLELMGGLGGLNGTAIQCQFKSCRAPELASGTAIEIFRNMFRVSGNRIVSFTAGLSFSKQAAVVRDWELSRAKIHTELTLKISHWTQLPQALCGLAHWNESAAKTCANHCLLLWDQNKAAGISHSHWMTRRFLDPDWKGVRDPESPLRPFAL